MNRPFFTAQFSKDHLVRRAQKSVAWASRKYGKEFMNAALDETTKLSKNQIYDLAHSPDFGEAVARWFIIYSYFKGESLTPFAMTTCLAGLRHEPLRGLNLLESD
jgi:hypothetical protein